MNKYVIETKQLTKTYGEQTVVNSVNIHVKQGQIYWLLRSEEHTSELHHSGQSRMPSSA